MDRLVSAYYNSARAFRRLAGSEAAFRQELFVLALAFPFGWFVASSWQGYAVLIVSVLFLLVVEVLNTGIEGACDAVSRDFNPDIQYAKDCGSLAVLISIVIVAGVWVVALFERIYALLA